MTEAAFPRDTFVHTVVQLLDTIQHQDTNYTHEERVRNLSYAYNEAARHFAQPHVRDSLHVKPKKLQAALQTITGMVVYCWVKASPELMAALTIHYTYTLILDDDEDDPYPTMENFFDDMVGGKEQKHPWWRLVNDHFPNVLKHYGPFCSLNIYRSTVDFFEGCWIEQYAFHGYKGSSDYPDFLRRMNGLGHAVGASIWPAEMFDERKLFKEITTAICMMENWMVWVNDLISFYKEFDDERDQTSLVNNYCHVGGLTVEEGLEKLTANTLRVSREIMGVFEGKDPLLAETLTRFMHGYVTWHLCDKRYRINEIQEGIMQSGGGGDVERRFCHYFEEANKVGRVDAAEWVVPLTTIVKQQQQQEQKHQKLQQSLSHSYLGAVLLSARNVLNYVLPVRALGFSGSKVRTDGSAGS